MKDYYKILEIEHSASSEQILAAYNALYPKEKFSWNRDLLKEAYTTLISEEKRVEYDKSLLDFKMGNLKTTGNKQSSDTTREALIGALVINIILFLLFATPEVATTVEKVSVKGYPIKTEKNKTGITYSIEKMELKIDSINLKIESNSTQEWQNYLNWVNAFKVHPIYNLQLNFKDSISHQLRLIDSTLIELDAYVKEKLEAKSTINHSYLKEKIEKLENKLLQIKQNSN